MEHYNYLPEPRKESDEVKEIMDQRRDEWKQLDSLLLAISRRLNNKK